MTTSGASQYGVPIRDFRLSVGDCIFTLTPKSAGEEKMSGLARVLFLSLSLGLCMSMSQSLSVFVCLCVSVSLSIGLSVLWLCLSVSVLTQFHDACVCE